MNAERESAIRTAWANRGDEQWDGWRLLIEGPVSPEGRRRFFCAIRHDDGCSVSRDGELVDQYTRLFKIECEGINLGRDSYPLPADSWQEEDGFDRRMAKCAEADANNRLFRMPVHWIEEYMGVVWREFFEIEEECA